MGETTGIPQRQIKKRKNKRFEGHKQISDGSFSPLSLGIGCRLELSLVWKLLPFYLPYLIRSNFIKTTYDISLDSQISFLPLGFSPTEVVSCLSSVGNLNPKVRRQRNLVLENIYPFVARRPIANEKTRNIISISLFIGRPLAYRINIQTITK